MVFRTAGAIATARRSPLRLTLTSCRRSMRRLCRAISCRRSEWDPLIRRCPARGINREPAVIQQTPDRCRPLAARATRVFSRKTTRRLQRTLTARAASFRPAHPIRLNRMQFGKRQCDRGCGTAPGGRIGRVVRSIRSPSQRGNALCWPRDSA